MSDTSIGDGSDLGNHFLGRGSAGEETPASPEQAKPKKVKKKGTHRRPHPWRVINGEFKNRTRQS